MTSKNVPTVFSESEINERVETETRADQREKELFDWLHSLELTHHFDNFLDHGYEDLEICMEIGEVDLHAIGVSDIHERLALLQSVRQLRQQQQQQQQQKTKPKSKPINNNNTNEVSTISPMVASADVSSASMSFHAPVTSSLYSTWNYPKEMRHENNSFFTSKPRRGDTSIRGGQLRETSMRELPMQYLPKELRGGNPTNSGSLGGFRFNSESDNRNYVEVNDDDDVDDAEPLYESVSPVPPDMYAMSRVIGSRSNPMTPKHFPQSCAIVRDRFTDANNTSNEKISGLNHAVGCEEESFCYASNSIPPPGTGVNLARLRTQLRDQVMQDGINISRISDEGILRTMAAQYAAELASTMTLTPSSTSACSTSSESSNLSNCSSSSGPTPADAHYQHVLNQLRELWLEERMKLYPLASSECTCGDNLNGRLMGFKSSTASTPSASTPNGQPDCIMTVIHNSTLAAPRSVPCLASNPSNNNNGNLNKSPDRSHQTPHHQYLQHVIISNNFGQSPGHCSKAGHRNSVKPNYTPGIYLPSSCLLDKDEIYDYAPPVRISPQRRSNSPSKRCLTQRNGGNGRNGNSNLGTLLKGSSKSSYALSSNPSGIYGPNFDNFPKPVGPKTGSCRTLANLSKLSRRLGLSRFFRTLKIHGNAGASSASIRQSNARLQANSECARCSEEFNDICQCQFHGGRGTLPDLTVTAQRYACSNPSEKPGISSLPSNERIIQTINRLKLEELEKRKERIAQEHRMVRDTLFYMLPRN